MKKLRLFSASMLFATVALFYPNVANAETSEQKGDASVELTIIEEDGVRDPENPDKEVNPGPSPSTDGKLRIDFVPQLHFSNNELISGKDMLYSVNAQLFLDDTPARGNYIQISDFRGGAEGWTLQVRQESQFTNNSAKNTQLNGAVISFDKSWASSTVGENQLPTVSKDIINLTNIGETYNLAEAKTGTGQGITMISFGASSENPAGQAGTLTPRTLDGKPVTDANFNNQQVYANEAIKLLVPGATARDAVEYTTVLTWILAELP